MIDRTTGRAFRSESVPFGNTPLSASGDEVHRTDPIAGFHLMVRPQVQSVAAPSTDTLNPLLLLHGTGGDESDLIPFGEAIAPGALLISPRGRAPEGNLNRWFARSAPGVLDEDDIRRRGTELDTFLSVLRDDDRLTNTIDAAGFSNGANMLAAMLLLHPGSIRNAVLMRPMLPLRPETVPDLSGVSVAILAGTVDTMIPATSTQELIDLLRNAGADVSVTWTDAGHRFLAEEVDIVGDWLAERRD